MSNVITLANLSKTLIFRSSNTPTHTLYIPYILTYVSSRHRSPLKKRNVIILFNFPAFLFEVRLSNALRPETDSLFSHVVHVFKFAFYVYVFDCNQNPYVSSKMCLMIFKVQGLQIA